MKLTTFIGPEGTRQIGALVEDDQLVMLQAGAIALEGTPTPHFHSMLSFLRGGAAASYKAHVVIDFVTNQRPPGTLMSLELVTLLAPVPVPESIRDGMAFEQHIINAIRRAGFGRLAIVDETVERLFGRKASLAYRLNKAWYQRPVYYKSNRFSVVGHGANVAIPSYAGAMDYELEWGVFIGAPGSDIPESKAASHIAGYVVFNDFSARDIQMAEMAGRLGPAKGKDFDTGNAIGPWLVTPEEIPDPYDLAMTARVNGEEWSRGSTRDMHWTFEQMISYISRSETLYPGEFIGSGTCSGPEGSGCGLEMGRSLKAGDVVELEVERIGVLRNRLVARQPRRAPKGS
ncbi:MAG: fumarylacetoacetate hydrolase family protein [Hyphomicrobiales bacterium]|nr:fumarylacetoacetate hydrolase family protein [Hyphomicrobiales bacterium]